MQIITTALGVQYRRQEFVDSWGRTRVCDKRVDTLPKEHNVACECCGQPIDSERSTKKFCSAGCRVAWNRQQKRVASGD
jgi:predicted nucleic acid-binding Zn ribbon protein